jgi:hypothetical protein
MEIECGEITLTIGRFGKSTQKEFDEALAIVPGLIEKARSGNAQAGIAANEILWTLANESFNTRKTNPETFKDSYPFGNKE